MAGVAGFEPTKWRSQSFLLKFFSLKNEAKIHEKSSNLPHFAPSWIFTPQIPYPTPQNRNKLFTLTLTHNLLYYCGFLLSFLFSGAGQSGSRECMLLLFSVNKSSRQSPRTSIWKYSGLHFAQTVAFLLPVCFQSCARLWRTILLVVFHITSWFLAWKRSLIFLHHRPKMRFGISLNAVLNCLFFLHNKASLFLSENKKIRTNLNQPLNGNLLRAD